MTRPAGVVRNAVIVMHGTGGSGRPFTSASFGGILFKLFDTRSSRHPLVFCAMSISRACIRCSASLRGTASTTLLTNLENTASAWLSARPSPRAGHSDLRT